MLKACLILVIAFGLAALGVSQFQVKAKIDQLTGSLAQAEQDAQTARQAQRQAENAENQAKAELETLNGTLNDVQTLSLIHI